MIFRISSTKSAKTTLIWLKTRPTGELLLKPLSDYFLTTYWGIWMNFNCSMLSLTLYFCVKSGQSRQKLGQLFYLFFKTTFLILITQFMWALWCPLPKLLKRPWSNLKLCHKVNLLCFISLNLVQKNVFWDCIVQIVTLNMTKW